MTPNAVADPAPGVATPEAIKQIRADARRLIKVLDAFATVKPGRADTLDVLAAALKKLPSADEIRADVSALESKVKAVMEAIRAERQEGFGRSVAAFVRTARGEGKSVRETSSGWRIGPLNVELDQPQAQARVLYNHEVVIKWSPVSAPEDLSDLEAQALKALEGKAIPDAALVDVMHKAFRNAPSRKASGSIVPVEEFLMQLRLELFAHQLAGKPDRRLPASALAADMPQWAFLYNIDRYRARPSQPGSPRLGFQTCAMREAQEGKGVTVNGMDAADDYRSICYVTGPEA